jgi:CheY-like chemotaxis protein
VLSVAKDFRPDFILCDTVLPKKDGFTVCKELKNDSLLKSIPVILIYSGFVGIQKEKILEAKANGTLEKPFEAEQLRSLVNQFVNKTNNQKISEFLSFPRMGAIGLEPTKAQTSEDEIEDFAQVPLMPPPMPTVRKANPPPAPTPREPQNFTPTPQAEDNDYELEIPDYIQVNDLDGVEVVEAEDYDVRPTNSISARSPNFNSSAPSQSSTSYEPEEDDFEIGGLELIPPKPAAPSQAAPAKKSLQDRIAVAKTNPTQAPPPPQPRPSPQGQVSNQNQQPISAKTAGSLMQLDPAHLEKLLESHIQQAIESALWKVLPDIAERVLKEEIDRLKKDIEQDT